MDNVNTACFIYGLLGKPYEVVMYKISLLNDDELHSLRMSVCEYRELLYKLSGRCTLFSTKEYLWRVLDEMTTLKRLASFEDGERLDRKYPPLQRVLTRSGFYASVALHLRRAGVNLNGPKVVYNSGRLQKYRRAVIRKAARTLIKKL